MSTTQQMVLAVLLALEFVGLCVGICVVVHRGCNQILRDLDRSRVEIDGAFDRFEEALQ